MTNQVHSRLWGSSTHNSAIAAVKCGTASHVGKMVDVYFLGAPLEPIDLAIRWNVENWINQQLWGRP